MLQRKTPKYYAKKACVNPTATDTQLANGDSTIDINPTATETQPVNGDSTAQ